jgi:vesicle-associated membrane protein 4
MPALALRDEKLSGLKDKVESIAKDSRQFRWGANRLRKQMWWKDVKWRICLILGIIAVLLTVIIIPAGWCIMQLPQTKSF